MTHHFSWAWEEVLFDERELVLAEATLQLEKRGKHIWSILKHVFD